jgi:hypothetical protein
VLLNTEFYLWFFLPTLIGLFVVIKSTQISLRRKSVTAWVLTIIILLLTALSETILYQIFFQGSWASYVPHVMIGLSLVLFGLQFVFARQKKIVEK